jgi:hypothetical protein
MENKQKRVYKIVLTGGKKKVPRKTRQRARNEWAATIIVHINDKSIECIYLQVLVAVKPLDNHVYARSSKTLDGRLVALCLFFAPVEYKPSL